MINRYDQEIAIVRTADNVLDNLGLLGGFQGIIILVMGILVGSYQ